MVVAGVLTIASAVIPQRWGFVVMITSPTLAAIVPIIDSYIIWSRERGGPTRQ